MTTTLRYLFSGFLLLLAGCSKDAPETSPNLSSMSLKQTLSVRTMDAAANPQNPYDYIGHYHNIGLDSLRHYEKISKDTTRRGKYAYISRYFKSNFGADVQLVDNPNERLACTDYKALWLNQKVSAAARVYWQALSEVPQGIKDLDHYDDYKKQLMVIENKIIAAQLPADERKNLLLTASILRYSGYYWINAFKNGEVIQHLVDGGLDMPDGFLRKIAGVITGICADASVIGAGYMSGDYAIIGSAFWLSSICGYYTGWW